MATLSQNQSSVRYYMGWYGNCSQDPNSPTGGCVPFDLSSDPKIKIVWEVSDGIKAFTSESPTFSPIQELEAGRCYMIALNPGDGAVEIPHMVLSGEGGYVGQSCAMGQFFVTVEAHTMPYTTPVVDTSYGYYPVQYSPGDTVTLTANTKEGRRFEGWTSFSPASIWAEVTDPSSPTISFTMPSEPVTAKLDYLDLTRDTDGDGIPDHEDPYPNQSTQIIDWTDTDLSLLTVGDTAELKATAETDITYTISDSSVGTINGDILTIVGDGTAVVTATAVASAQWFEASATTSFQTDADSDGDGIPDSQDDDPYQQSQTIVWDDDLSDLNVGDTFTLTASAQTAVTYASSDTSIATISGNTLSLVAEGSVTITATAESSSDYFTATSVVNAYITTPTVITLVDTSLNNLDTASAVSIGVNTSQTVFTGGEQIIYTLGPALASEQVINFTATRSDTGEQISVTENYSSASHDFIYEFYIPTDMTGGGTITISAEIETQVAEEPLTLSINDDGKLEVSFDYPEFASYDPETRCYKILLTFFEDTYELRRMAWRPDAIGVHPENQRITFVVEDRPEFLGAADQVNGKVNQAPHNSHLDSFTVYHTANRATGSDIYGNASTYYNWGDYIRSTRVRAELKIDSYETFHSISWFDYSSGTEPPSAEIDLPDTNGNGIWDSLDWDDEFQYSLSGDIITGSFRYSDKIFLNNGAGTPSNYPDGYPAISLKWTDDYNGSSDTSLPAWEGSLASSYSEGELVNFTFNANSIYSGTLDHLNYRYPIHTDSDTSKPIQFSLDFMYPSSYSSNMVRSSGPRVADYNWDADGDSHFDALDVYTAERVGSNIRVTFPYREGVFGVTINQDYAVELTFKDENGSWVAWGVDWWTQGSNNYSDGEIITIEQPLPTGYEQYMNNELTVEWSAGTGGGTTWGRHMMVRKTLPAVVATAPTFDGWNMVVDSPAQVEMPSDGSVPQTDVNGDPLFIAYPEASDPQRVHFTYLHADRSDGTTTKELILNNRSDFEVRFAKYGPIHIIYTDLSGNVFDTPLDIMGTYAAHMDDNMADVAFPTSSTSVGSVIFYFNLNTDIATLHGVYGDFAIYMR